MKTGLALFRRGLELLVDTILPLRARASRTRNLSLEDVPLIPTSHDLLGHQITTLMDYQDQKVKDLIQSLKYDGSGYAAHLCATILAEYLIEEIGSEKAFSIREIHVVPLPLHSSRQRERGYNQIGLVLDALPPEFRDGSTTHLSRGLLIRVRPTKAQTHLVRSERLRNVSGAFSLHDGAEVSKTHVFLIDDVTTTGATLVHAATPLRKAGASVSLIALARA